MKTKVLHVLPWIGGGGVERRRALIAEYSGDEFEHRYFALRATGASAARIRAAGGRIDDAGIGELKGVKPYLKLMEAVRSFRPHIIHGAVFEGNILAATLGALLRVPIVVLEETSLPIYRKPRAERLFQTLALAADRVVAISPQVADYLRDRARVPASKVATITNGIEELDVPTPEGRQAARAQWDVPADALVLGTLSRLVDDENKRVSDVIRAMPEILKHQPHAHLLVCGDGGARSGLEALARELNLEDCVTFAGTVVAKEGLYAMDIFVHAASHEGFGLAVAEAAFCALPIVTTGVGGIAEIVIPEKTGVFVPVGDSAAIAEAVVRLEASPALREKMGQAGRARALERFSAERYVRDVEALYRALIAEKKVRL